MTTEDDFQRVLESNPDDWQTRLVFADWLEEHDDPRAEGMRAIVAIGVRPIYWSGSDLWGWLTASMMPRYASSSQRARQAVVPDDWYAAIERHPTYPQFSAERRTAREAYDDLARAFAKLSPARRAFFLAIKT